MKPLFEKLNFRADSLGDFVIYRREEWISCFWHHPYMTEALNIR